MPRKTRLEILSERREIKANKDLVAKELAEFKQPSECSVARLVVWLTERALKEDSR